ncbi:MAG TPA: ribosome maturation factor RimM [Xanthobacteraceae bacterium]
MSEQNGRSGSPDERRVCVGQFGAAHGIRGEVRLKAFTADPLAIRQYGPLQSEDGARTFEIVSLRPAKDMLVARLKGVDDRNAAETLCNLRLYVPRERLAPPEEDEFYHADLIGLAAVDTTGQPLGTVAGVPNYGAGDLLEIAPAGGGATVLLPFSKAAVPHIDIAGGRVTVDPPAGTFPSPLGGEGGERSEPGDEAAPSQADEPPETSPLTGSSPSARNTLSRKRRE